MQFNIVERDTISSMTKQVTLVTGNIVTTYDHGTAPVQNFFDSMGLYINHGE